MTTEDDFQRQLDAHPEDWQCRLVFADWLEERDDPRAEGYRALGVNGLWPHHYLLDYSLEESDRYWWWWWWDDDYAPFPAGDPAALPQAWWLDCKDEWRTRREAEDAAARAFARLPAERRAELLAVAPV